MIKGDSKMIQFILNLFEKSTVHKGASVELRFDLKQLQLEKARQLGMTDDVKVLRKELHAVWLEICALS